MAHAGAIVTVSREGDAEVIRGLVREADRKAITKSHRGAGRYALTDGSELSTVESDGQTHAGRKHTSDCSESLAKRLAAHRTMALQAMLSRDTPVALASLAHVLAQRTFCDDFRRAGTAVQIAPQLSGYALEGAADDLKGSVAWQVIDSAKQAWRARLPEQPSQWLVWLIQLPQAELIEIIALCTALTLNALPQAGGAAEADALAGALELDMADWWEPTVQSYLNHVPKAQIVRALKEVGAKVIEAGVGAMKKESLVVKAEVQLAGKRWLPEALGSTPS